MNPASLAPNIPEITLDQLRPIPEPWQDVSLQGCLIEASAIARRIQDLARQIEQNADPSAPLVVISILAGAAIFSSDLIRALRCPLEWAMIGLSSYREGTTSGDLQWTLPLARDIRGQQVLVVDDILDTGQTLKAVVEHLHTLRPASVQTCVLLDKQISCPSDNSTSARIQADHVGFQIEDAFVVGYGLDMGGQFRQLPFVATLSPRPL